MNRTPPSASCGPLLITTDPDSAKIGIEARSIGSRSKRKAISLRVDRPGTSTVRRDLFGLGSGGGRTMQSVTAVALTSLFPQN